MKIRYLGNRPTHRVTLGHKGYNFNKENSQIVEVEDNLYVHFLQSTDNPTLYVMDVGKTEKPKKEEPEEPKKKPKKKGA